MFTPIKKDKLFTGIVDQIIKIIESGEFKKGDRLPSERDLALKLGVSRTTIREAIRTLETIGYVETKQGGGNYISNVDLGNIISPLSRSLGTDRKLLLELIDVRKLLEGETTRLAALNNTKEGHEEIENSLALMKKELDEGGIGLNGDRAFHIALAKAADNEALRIILEMCSDLLDSTRAATLQVKGQGKSSLKDHKEIAEAIYNGKSEEAVNKMMNHLKKAFENINNQNEGNRKGM